MRSLATALAVLCCLSFTSVAASTERSGTDAPTIAPAARSDVGFSSPRRAIDVEPLGRTSPEGLAALAQAPPPVMALDKSSLAFGALTSGSTFVRQTGTQLVRLTQAGAGTVTWTASSLQPWLQVTPASGTGGATLRVSVSPSAGLPSTGTLIGSVVVSFNGASTASGVINVSLGLQVNGTSAAPFGYVDTPVDNSTGATGAVPFTGWAMDDVDVAAVSVCRAAFGAEVAGPDGRCGGAAQIYVGDAVFIEGARPDLPTAYPTYPRNTQAGWGLMVLTNMLPAQGNGVYSFTMWARDVEGASTLLGSRTMTCDNAHATRPFGTIDTPIPGETISGSLYVNFGWALTQNPKIITKHILAMVVVIDGEWLGNTEYGFYRSDIATLFPGLRNSDGAVAYRYLEPLTMTNGLHTISWTVTDDGGNVEGLGSRYFSVSNDSAVTRRTAAARAAATASAPAVDATTVATVPLDATPIQGRRGFAPDAPFRRYAADAAGGRMVVQGEELDRFELQLNAGDGGRFAGYVRVGSTLQPLPIGSRLNPTSGVFTWSPGVGFVGTYDLVFVRGTAAKAVARQEVRFVLRAKGSGPQVLIDMPTALQTVGQPFVVAGWAADLEVSEGTGIDTVHVWAYPLSGSAPLFLGVASPSTARPDVAAAYGDQFGDSGYGLVVQGLDPGTYDLAVFAWSAVRANFLPARVVRITVR